MTPRWWSLHHEHRAPCRSTWPRMCPRQRSLALPLPPHPQVGQLLQPTPPHPHQTPHRAADPHYPPPSPLPPPHHTGMTSKGLRWRTPHPLPPPPPQLPGSRHKLLRSSWPGNAWQQRQQPRESKFSNVGELPPPQVRSKISQPPHRGWLPRGKTHNGWGKHDRARVSLVVVKAQLGRDG